MKFGMLTSSLSRNAGVIHDAVRGLARAIASLKPHKVKAFGIVDEYTFEDEPAWVPVAALSYGKGGPIPFGHFFKLIKGLLGEDLELVHVHGLWTFASCAGGFRSVLTRRPYIVSPHGMLDAWALAQGHLKKLVAKKLFERW